MEHTKKMPQRESLASISHRRLVAAKEKSLYLLPNIFTASSLLSAFYGMLASIDGDFVTASLAIFLAMIFDGMDGRVARLTHTQSEFGVQMDSLADAVSFGVAPALIMYKFALFELGKVGWAIAFIYALCALLRLARFNCMVGIVSKNYFQGLPSPAAAALVCGFVWVVVENHLPDTLTNWVPEMGLVVTLYAGLTMVSNAPFFSGKNLAACKTVPFWVIVTLSVLFVVISSTPSFSLFILLCLYALSGYAYGFWCWYKGKTNPIQADIEAQLEKLKADEASEAC